MTILPRRFCVSLSNEAGDWGKKVEHDNSKWIPITEKNFKVNPISDLCEKGLNQHNAYKASEMEFPRNLLPTSSKTKNYDFIINEILDRTGLQ